MLLASLTSVSLTVHRVIGRRKAFNVNRRSAWSLALGRHDGCQGVREQRE